MSETQFDVQIQEYSATAAMINDLQGRIGSKVYDASTPEGMLVATRDNKEVRSVIIGLEKIRKEIKAPALKRCKDIDGEAKAITAQLEAIQDAPLSAIKAEEERQAAIAAEAARVEAERVAKLRSIIDKMASFPGRLATADSSMVRHTIKTVELIDVGAEFGEFRDEAVETKGRVLTDLATMLDQKVQAEKDAADLKAAREAQEREQRAAAEELRIARAEQARAAKEAQDALDAKDAELARLRAEAAEKDAAVGKAVAEEFSDKEFEIVAPAGGEEPASIPIAEVFLLGGDPIRPSRSLPISTDPLPGGYTPTVERLSRPVQLLRALVRLLDGNYFDWNGDPVTSSPEFVASEDYLAKLFPEGGDHD